MYRAHSGFSTALSIGLTIVVTFALAGCGAAVTAGGAKTFSPTNPDVNKPSPSDFTGAPGIFAGQWQGPCSNIDHGLKTTDCSAVLTLKQDTMNSFVMGTLTYTIGYMTSAPILIHRLDIDGNDLSLNGARVGKIGQHALMFNDQSMGDFSALLSGNTLGVNIQQVPSLGAAPATDQRSVPADCSQNYCFTAALRKVDGLSN